MLRLHSQLATPRLRTASLCLYEQLPPRPLPAQGHRLLYHSTARNRAGSGKGEENGSGDKNSSSSSSEKSNDQSNDKTNDKSTEKSNDKSTEKNSIEQAKKRAARIRRSLPGIDINSVYKKAQDIIAKTTAQPPDSAKVPDGQAEADTPGEAAEAADNVAASDSSRTSKRLLRQLREHLGVLEEFLKVEEQRERAAKRKAHKTDNAEPTATQAATTTDADTSTIGSDKPLAAHTNKAAKASKLNPSKPQQGKSITWADIHPLRSALAKLQSARESEKISRVSNKARKDDEAILSVAQHVFKEQNIDLKKKKPTKPHRSGGGGGGGNDRDTTDAGFVRTPKISDSSAGRSSTGSVEGDAPGADSDVTDSDWTASKAVKSIRSKRLRLIPVDVNEARSPPALSYNLDRVLFNPGVFQLQDLRSKVWNFDPYLAKIMPIAEFDYNALKGYTTSSKDSKLISIAAEHGRLFCGSTSSMTGVLTHFHYLLSDWRPLGMGRLSKDFQPDSQNFTEITRSPSAIFLRWRDGVYAIDADKEFDTATILSMLGRSLEKLLTLPQDEYEKYRRSRSDELTEEQRHGDEVYHYSQLGDFMMRSQLDAYDKRLPGAGVFDLKTRAVVTVRMDAQQFEKRRDYEIKRRHGEYESYEREYYDLIRSAFLKYSLQVRMGRMDGIFLAYHNTQRIFGFQYVPLSEMDEAMHGTPNLLVGDAEFKLSLQLWNEVLKKVMAKFRGRSIRMHFETRSAGDSFMYVFAKPVTEDEVAAIQDANTKAVEDMENKILGITRQEAELEAAEEQAEQDRDDEQQQQKDQREALSEAEESPESPRGNVTSAEEGSDQHARENIETAAAAADQPAESGKLSAEEDVWEAITQRVEESMENEELGVEHVRDSIRTALDHSGLMRDVESDNVERYVDSLLEILIPEEAQEEAQTEEQQTEERTEELTETAAEEAADMVEDALEATTKMEKAEEAQTESQAEESQAELDQSEVHPEPSPTTKAAVTLKELLLQQVKTKEAGAADAADDDERLVSFGRLLSELVAPSQSRKNAAEESQGGRNDDGDASWEEVNSAVEAETSHGELMGMTITIRNKVNGEYVKRVSVDSYQTELDWELEYNIKEMEPGRAQLLYAGLLDRRRKALLNEEKRSARSARFSERFQRKMDELSKQGKRFRTQEDRYMSRRPLYVVGEDKPRTWQSVFGLPELGSKMMGPKPSKGA